MNMRMICDFQMDVTVQHFALFCELAFLERRPELGLLCREARQAGRLDAGLCDKLLPGIGPAGAANLLRWCEHLRLCDGGGALTPLGIDAAERDEAPVPEQGVFDLWVLDHPLTGLRLVHVRRLTARPDSQEPEAAPLPCNLLKEPIFSSLLDPTERFVLREVLGQGCIRRPDVSCRLRWRWDLGKDSTSNEWWLEGSLEGSSFRSAPEQTQQEIWDLWSALCGQALAGAGRWDRERRLLLAPLEQLSDEEQERFARDQDLGPGELPGIGPFCSARVTGLPLGPSGTAEASEWALRRLDRKLRQKRRYRSPAEVRAVFRELCDGTVLAAAGPTLPPHDRLLERYVREPGVQLLLAAPVDLSPQPLPTQDLAGLSGKEAA